MRWRNSPAAFSVNVIAAIDSIGTPSSTSVTTRPTSALVLPAPAPASTNSVAAVSVRIRSRSAWSGGGSTPFFASASAAGGEHGRGRLEVELELNGHDAGSVGAGNQRASRSSWRLRSHSGQRSPVPRLSGWQYLHPTKCW